MRTCLPLLLSTILATSASAQITSFIDSAAWQAAVGNFERIGFDEVPAGTPIGTAFTALGVTFPENEVNVFDAAFLNDGLGVEGESGGGGAIEVLLAAPIQAIACDYPGAITIRLFSGTTQLGQSIDFGGTGGGFFGGVTSQQSFDRVIIYDWFDWDGSNPDTSATFIDDLLFEPPALGSLGTEYCAGVANSTGLPADLQVLGSAVAADNNLTLLTSQLPTDRFGFFLVSPQQGFIANPNGSQGNLCLTGATGRFRTQIFNSGATGSGSISVDLTMVPTPTGPTAVMSGDTLNFQCWYRDRNPGNTSNLSDAESVLFQ
jgi:hypothetical protein